METRTIILSELAADGVDVLLHCRDCGNQVVAAAHQLASHFGQTLALGSLRGHLKCPLCGSVDVEAAPGPWARHASLRPRRFRR